jgi:hypothetical protein
LWWWNSLAEIFSTSPAPPKQSLPIGYLIEKARRNGFPAHVFEMLDQHHKSRTMGDLIKKWRFRELVARLGDTTNWPAYAAPFYLPDISQQFIREIENFQIDLRDSKTEILRNFEERLTEIFYENGLGDRPRNAGRANRLRYFSGAEFEVIELIDRRFLLRQNVRDERWARVRAILREFRRTVVK